MSLVSVPTAQAGWFTDIKEKIDSGMRKIEQDTVNHAEKKKPTQSKTNSSGPKFLASQIGPVKKTDAKGNIIKEGELHPNGTFSGVAREYYDNGQLKEEGQYLLGQRHGSFQSYYINGKRKVECTYYRGGLHDEYKEFYISGKKKLEGEYINNVRNGDFKEYHDNGKLKQKRTYKNDYLVGIKHYDEKGKELK